MHIAHCTPRTSVSTPLHLPLSGRFRLVLTGSRSRWPQLAPPARPSSPAGHCPHTAGQMGRPLAFGPFGGPSGALAPTVAVKLQSDLLRLDLQIVEVGYGHARPGRCRCRCHGCPPPPQSCLPSFHLQSAYVKCAVHCARVYVCLFDFILFSSSTIFHRQPRARAGPLQKAPWRPEASRYLL
jgi:hypothetical protein